MMTRENQFMNACGTHHFTVTKSHTAEAMGSGTVPVCATPAIVAGAEAAAVAALAPLLTEHETSVGIHIDLAHLAATPIGMEITSKAKVTALEGKKITFAITVYDECGLVANATHERFLVTTEKFLAKAEQRKK